MISNKLLCIDKLLFSLPDDFDGTVTDALELVVQYRRSREAEQNRVFGEKYDADKEPETMSFGKAYDTLEKQSQSRLQMSCGLLSRDIETGKWSDTVEEDKLI